MRCANIDHHNGSENKLSDDVLTKQNESEARYSVEDAIETIGFGKFQVKVLGMIGFAWMSDSLEMALLAILAPAIRCEWGLTHWHEAGLTTVVFIGMFISTYCWGYLSDNFGRRKVLLGSSFGVFFFGLLSTWSVSYVMILALRGCVGLSMGGIVQGTTLIVEFLPQKTRGLTVNFGSVFWSIGASFEIIMAMFVMPKYGWRYLLFFSAWPCLIFVVTSLISKYPPESARFLVSKNRSEEATNILQRGAEDNKRELPDGVLHETTSAENCEHGSIKGMFTNGYWKTTILLWIIWFASHFNIYGLALFTTALFSSSYTCYGNEEKNLFQTMSKADDCKMLSANDYLHFFYILAADFPAVIITGILADTVGRRWLQAIGFFTMGIFFSLLFICTESRAWATFFLFGVRCFAAVADIGGYIYTPEVYPTHIRGIAMGSCSGISRLGCMLTPFVSQVLTHHSLYLALSIYVAFSVIGGIASLLLPVETMGKGLEEINNDMKKLSSNYLSSDVDDENELLINKNNEIDNDNEAYNHDIISDNIILKNKQR